MSTSCAETVGLAFVDAFNRRDADALVATCDPAVEWHPTVLVGGRRVYRGHEGIRRWIVDLAASAVQHQSTVLSVRILGVGRFVVFADLDTGDGGTTPAAMVARLGDGGLIAEARGYLSDESLLEQLGALEP
jgi:hypothetical protein